jgi:hypothetical protein
MKSLLLIYKGLYYVVISWEMLCLPRTWHPSNQYKNYYFLQMDFSIVTIYWCSILLFLPSDLLISYHYKLDMFTKGLLIISCFVWNSSSIFSYQESISNLSRILLLSYQYGNAMCYQGADNLVTNRSLLCLQNAFCNYFMICVKFIDYFYLPRVFYWFIKDCTT